jgi:hypothetical protein
MSIFHRKKRAQPDHSFEVVELDPAAVRFTRRGDTLSLTTGGRTYPRVVLRRCFPVSEEEEYVSVRDATANGQDEVGVLRDCSLLAEEDRAAVLEELRSLYFVPRIERVVAVKEEFGFSRWTVETDRGPSEFVMRDGVITYTREVGPDHWLLIDVDQGRWEIPTFSALDGRSQKLIGRTLYI